MESEFGDVTYRITVEAFEDADISLVDTLEVDGDGNCELILKIDGEVVRRFRGDFEQCRKAMDALKEDYE